MKSFASLIAIVLVVFSGTAHSQLVIVRATYGAGNVQKDVTAIVAAQLQGGRVQMEVGNHTMGGDPIFGESKRLAVQYRTAAGDYVVTVQEGDMLELPSTNALPLPGAPVAASQSPPVTGGAPTPQPAPRRVAPEGEFFLTQRVTVTTSDGIVGLPPGTSVRLLGETGTQAKVVHGSHEFEVEKSQLTKDVDVAASGAQGDWLAQREIAQRNAEQARNLKAGQLMEKMRANGLQSDVFVKQITAGGVLGYGTAYGKGKITETITVPGTALDREPRTRQVTREALQSAPLGDIFVHGLGAGMIDGQTWKGKLWPAGTYTYTTVLGASRTIRAYVTTPEEMIARLKGAEDDPK